MESLLELEAAAVEKGGAEIAEVASGTARMEADVKTMILVALVRMKTEVRQALSTINVWNT